MNVEDKSVTTIRQTTSANMVYFLFERKEFIATKHATSSATR
jgi:hypothetical protein